MQQSMMINAALIIAIGIVLISTNSIAIQCYNDNASYKAERAASYNWVMLNLAAAALVVMYGGYEAYKAYISV